MESGATWDKLCMYRIFQTIRRMCPPPNLGGKWGCVLLSECSLPGLLGAGVGGSGGAGSQEAGAGSLLQEACGSRSGAILWALG